MNGRQARIVARYETAMHLLSSGADPSRLDSLLAESVAILGEDDPGTFMIACGVEELRGDDRPIAESARVWSTLRTRAERTLPDEDPSLMTIRSFHARYTRGSGGSADLDAGVLLYEAEWAFRRGVLGADHFRTRTARANHALALRDRGREGDLDTALTMLREESTHRRARYGGGHPFTWTAQTILAQTLLRVAERAGGPAADAAAREALTLAASVTQRRQWRFGWSDPATLKAHLVHAHALLLLDEPALAIPEIEHVLTKAARTQTCLQPGWPESLLARAEAAAGSPNAPATARHALELCLNHLSPDSRQVREARLLAESLGVLSRTGPNRTYRPPNHL